MLGPASKVAPVDKLSVALTILMAIFILGEKADAKAMIGGILIFLGSFVLVF